ncbi:MAG: PQQ-binding-like beta-propeller repeat protein [Acidobacteriota bacterium]
MTRRLVYAIACLCCAGGWIAFPSAADDQGQASARPVQEPGPPTASAKKADWLTDGSDARRTAWQQNETLLTTANVKDMKLLWKVKLEVRTRQMHALFPALIVGNATTSAGPKEIAVVAGISDVIYALDVEKGTILWKTQFESTYKEPPPVPGGRGGSVLCPGGLTATPVIAPAVTPGKYIIYAVSWDGRLRKLDLATGDALEPPELFLPPNGKPYGLNLVNGVLYTTTAQGCGGNPNNFYSYDLATKKVGNYNPGSGGLWPRSGPSVGKDGTVYAGSGDGDYLPEQQIYGQAMIGVKQNADTKALELKDWYAPSNAEWMRKRDLDFNTTGPIFDYKGKEYLVQSSKECRLWLLDTAMLGGEDHRTPAYRTPLVCNEEVNFTMGVWGALASWQDSAGTRWVLTPFWGPKHPAFKAPIEHGPVVYGAVAAFKLEDRAGKPQLAPAWISRDMYMADPPVVANGIVFGYGSGESTTQRWPEPGHVGGAQGRIQESTHAVLYALDGQTGKELWSSGDQITSWNHFTGLSVANGRVYIGTFDGMLYCFGAPSLPAGRTASAAAAAGQESGR